MWERVRDSLREGGLISAGDRVIVAVSGGPDSVALLHILHRSASELGISLHLFHLDHGLRGAASAGDARYVRELADRLGVPSTVVALPPGELKHQSGSLQANARAIRYAEMEALAARIGASRIALGHNRDDQAETVLMRFLRGTGIRGLAGIPQVRMHKGLTYIRPLLGISRNEIEAYCKEYELSPRMDESNARSDYQRNRIRLNLIPQLEREYNPALKTNLAQMAVLLRDEEELLAQLADAALARCRVPGDALALDGRKLTQEPLAVARRVVRSAVQAVAGPDYDLGLESVSRVLQAVSEGEGTHELDLPRGIRLLVEYGVCRFEAKTCADNVAGEAEWPVSLTDRTIIAELGLLIEVLPVHFGDGGQDALPKALLEAAFDAGRIPGPLKIRFRHPGDRIWPTGMEGSKKLQDILVDAKVPQRLRDTVPLLAAGDEVLWVIGYRLDRRYLANASTPNVLRLRVTFADIET